MFFVTVPAPDSLLRCDSAAVLEEEWPERNIRAKTLSNVLIS